ncbi:PepSY domain-containing protein [uncultured Corynebacterium sp.]|uniref:PepSY domain-containing protein n=1 Tax=uncultured Corynebacterium sp. TaxID=159447 RepID=UPI0025E318B5|nr:PepSY domain-containing protein [uncultured Corynebacterium sp.]
MISRKLIALTAVTGLSLTLAACGDSNDTATTTSVEATATTATSAETATEETTATETSTDSQEATAATGDDPVFQAIDAVTAAHPGGIITDIDREDSTDVYEIDVVVGEEVFELVVNAGTGEVREEERDNDDAEDIREANDANITAAAAIEQALEQHPDGVLDEISLDEEDGRLEWDISLDDANRNDLTELVIQAN